MPLSPPWITQEPPVARHEGRQPCPAYVPVPRSNPAPNHASTQQKSPEHRNRVVRSMLSREHGLLYKDSAARCSRPDDRYILNGHGAYGPTESCHLDNGRSALHPRQCAASGQTHGRRRWRASGHAATIGDLSDPCRINLASKPTVQDCRPSAQPEPCCAKQPGRDAGEGSIMRGIVKIGAQGRSRTTDTAIFSQHPGSDTTGHGTHSDDYDD